jgi:alpha-beta hydrolase superfamily lysophospholipase
MSRFAGTVLLAALALVSTAPSGEAHRSLARRTAVAPQSPGLHRAQARRPLRLRETCITRDERRRVLRFRASDGVRLIGVVLGNGPRTVILAHQGGGPPDLCGWVPYARTLAAAGYRVLAFDHRGFGSSGNASRSTRVTRVDYDVLGAIRAMRARGATSIVLAGASLGASAVLSAAARATPPVNGVISLSSPARYLRINVLRAVRALRLPVLFVAAEGDSPFDEQAQQLNAACPSPDKRLVIVTGYDHGVALLLDSQVRETVGAFIARHSSS